MLPVRKYRIFGLAIFDIVMGAVGMIILFLLARARHYPTLNITPFVITAILVSIPVAITTHVLFGVNTKLNNMIGVSKTP